MVYLCSRSCSVPCCTSGARLRSRSCTPPPCACGHGHAAWPWGAKDKTKRWMRKGGEDEREKGEGGEEDMQTKMQRGRSAGADVGGRGGERGRQWRR